MFEHLQNLFHGAGLGGSFGHRGRVVGQRHGLVNPQALAGAHGQHLAVFHQQFNAGTCFGTDGFAALDNVAHLQGAGGAVGCNDDGVASD